MKTHDFYPKTFHQIPKADNPAFGEEECLMIVRECPLDGCTSKRSTVLIISPDPIESVTSVAVFWRHDWAKMYCEKFRVKEGDAADIGEKHPMSRHKGYTNEPLPCGATDEEQAAWERGKAARGR